MVAGSDGVGSVVARSDRGGRAVAKSGHVVAGSVRRMEWWWW